MKLYFMKQSALEFLKANMGTLYKNYYQFDSYEWIDELFDYDPFELFENVPDFELANLNLQPGEIDLRNCKILYSKMRDISDSQAADERLWAGLCNKTFYPYVRMRWQYARRHLKKSSDDAAAILSRYFYRNSGRSGMFRNTLSRCWWTGRLTYSEKYTNHWELLDAIGSEDIVSKISDIFYSNTYSSNPAIVEGFCQGLKFFKDRGISILNREHIRPTAQYLNAIGGGVLLDMFTADEIKNMVIKRIGMAMKGAEFGLSEEGGEIAEDRLDEEVNIDGTDAEEVNVDYRDYSDALEQSTEIDIDNVLGAVTSVEYGSKLYIRKMPGDTFFVSKMPIAGEPLNLLQKMILGKSKGDSVELAGMTYEIVDIKR